MPRGPLKVMFPIGVLKSSIALIDHENAETVWEYYLLENLSCGLVRDSRSSPAGYEGCLADKFYQEDPRSWTFQLKDLAWSDGSKVSEIEIRTWIQNLRLMSHRHVQFLPRMKSVLFDPATKKLKLSFPFTVDSSILHELSLADSGLMPVDYHSKGWGKTIGPYFVKSWDFKNGILRLVANSFSPLFRQEMPQEVELLNISAVDNKSQLFKEIPADIVPATALTDPKILSLYKKNSEQMVEAHPSSIFFLYFNHLNSNAHDLNFRLKIANIFAKVRFDLEKNTSVEFPLFPESQMVPAGFSGRLDHVQLEVNGKSTKSFDVDKVKIRFPEGLKQFPRLFETIREDFLGEGIGFEAVFGDVSTQEEDEAARCYGFVGNQLDSSGSWSFLIGPPKGQLSNWLPNLRKEFDQIFKVESLEERLEASRVLHQKILSNAFTIPFMIGRHRYFLSNQVDATRWNPFDSRLRLYELRWK